MNIAPLQNHCKSLGLDFPGRLYSHIEKSIEDGRYSLDQAVAWITEKANDFRDLMEYRDLFKSQTTVDSINNILSLKQFADELRIKIPHETMIKMELSVKDGKHSPSELANYLRGTAYEHFLQSKNVPSLSEADHTHLKTTLGPENYKIYVESIAAVSGKTGLPEPALDQIADKLFHDKAKTMKLYSDAISDVSNPDLGSQPESVIAFAKKVRVDMPPPRANLLCDLQLDKDELKKHIIHSSFETFSVMDRSFSKRLNTQLKPNTIASIDFE